MRVLISAVICLGSCAPIEVADQPATISRLENVVTIEDYPRRAQLILEYGRLRLEYRVHGELRASLFVENLADGRASGTAFDLERRVLFQNGQLDVGLRAVEGEEHDRAVLAGSALGEALRFVARFHVHAPALMAETEVVFSLAALLFEAPREAWPRYVHPDDAAPPGLLAGDVIGLGMTCATFIRCSGSAPFCVTFTHEPIYGFCTRSCAEDEQCGGLGRCALSVTDTPGISGALRMCSLECSPECPGRLFCSAGTCLPSQEVTE